MNTSVSFPLDNDGFLRRECPNCEREFKWLPSAGDGPVEHADTTEPGYFCPYCGGQADSGKWFTKPQGALIQYVARRDFVDPILRDFASGLERSSSKFVTVAANPDFRNDRPEPELTEANDMRRVDFDCHPSEPVKVVEGWNEPVRCLICGTAA